MEWCFRSNPTYNLCHGENLFACHHQDLVALDIFREDSIIFKSFFLRENCDKSGKNAEASLSIGVCRLEKREESDASCGEVVCFIVTLGKKKKE